MRSFVCATATSLLLSLLFCLIIPNQAQAVASVHAGALGQMATREAKACGGTYVVQKGDTLKSIAKRCGSTVVAIRELNDLTRRDRIYAGLRLRLPRTQVDAGETAQPLPESVRSHTIPTPTPQPVR